MRKHLLKPCWTLSDSVNNVFKIARFQEYYRVLQSVTEYYRVLQSITEYCRILQGFAEYCRLLRSVTECYSVLQSVTECYRVFLAHLLRPIFGLVLHETINLSVYHPCEACLKSPLNFHTLLLKMKVKFFLVSMTYLGSLKHFGKKLLGLQRCRDCLFSCTCKEIP